MPKILLMTHHRLLRARRERPRRHRAAEQRDEIAVGLIDGIASDPHKPRSFE
jgi:hypothetical protein